MLLLNFGGDSDEERKKVLINFFKLNVDILLEKNLVFATSNRFEGVCGFWTKNGMGLRDKIKLLKVLRFLPFSRLLKISKQRKRLQRAEKMFKDEKDYLFIFMIVVQEKDRGQGQMRKMMEFIINTAKEKNIPCVLETDSKRNAEIYHHFGFKTLSEQTIDDHFTYYILRKE